MVWKMHLWRLEIGEWRLPTRGAEWRGKETQRRVLMTAGRSKRYVLV
jgi:hypothetical protein